MLSPKEHKILKEIAEKQVITRVELKKATKEPKSILDTCLKSLLEKKYIATLSFSSRCYIITKTGIRALEDHE